MSFCRETWLEWDGGLNLEGLCSTSPAQIVCVTNHCYIVHYMGMCGSAACRTSSPDPDGGQRRGRIRVGSRLEDVRNMATLCLRSSWWIYPQFGHFSGQLRFFRFGARSGTVPSIWSCL